MVGNELRGRIDRLGLTYREAARLLGLTYGGLHHQMRGERSVTRQTELLLGRLEDERREAQAVLPPRVKGAPKRRSALSGSSKGNS